MDQAPVEVGEILAQKYRVDRVLGVGGMGVVVAATHLQLEQKVALKFMLRQAFDNPEALARFQREARAAVRLKSEHVARVSDTGTFDNGCPYIVMEYLEGCDLADELKREGPLPARVVAEYIIQACDALAEAHTLGIVHRDLKPANLFLARRADGSPIVKVLDFGISKVNSLTEAGVAMTKTSAMMGSPLYMSPEQIRSSKDVDARTDVWSLGVIMYELLGGRVPFMADTIGGLLSLVMMDPPLPLQLVQPDVPPNFAGLVDRCLAKLPGDRCQNVAEIARALAPFCPARSLPLVDRISNLIGGPIPALARTELVAAAPARPSVLAVSSPSMSAPHQTANAWAGTAPAATRPRSSTSGALTVGIGVGVVALCGVAAAVAIHLRAGSVTDAPPRHAAASVSAEASAPITSASALTLSLPSAQTRPDGGAGISLPDVTARVSGPRLQPNTLPRTPEYSKPPAATPSIAAPPTAAPPSTKSPGYDHM